jgi:very-short-patch-repair endonuclease
MNRYIVDFSCHAMKTIIHVRAFCDLYLLITSIETNTLVDVSRALFRITRPLTFIRVKNKHSIAEFETAVHRVRRACLSQRD